MRWLALIVGAGVLAVLAWWHGSLSHAIGAPFSGNARCDEPFCEAVQSLASTILRPPLPLGIDGRLPPPDVRGSIDARITQGNIGRTICRPGYSRSMRPSYGVTGPLKRRMMQAQYPDGRLADYELDHLIPISLGGAPFDAGNLWLQPRRGQANADDKNALAFVLWRLVCEHRLPLATAQRAISRDWLAAYETYATPQNVTKYHFQPRALTKSD